MNEPLTEHCLAIEKNTVQANGISRDKMLLLDFSLTVKAAPNECVIRTSQP